MKLIGKATFDYMCDYCPIGMGPYIYQDTDGTFPLFMCYECHIKVTTNRHPVEVF